MSYLTVPPAPKAPTPDMYQTMLQSQQAAANGYDPMAQQIALGGKQLDNPNPDFYQVRQDTEPPIDYRMEGSQFNANNAPTTPQQLKAAKVKKAKGRK